VTIEIRGKRTARLHFFRSGTGRRANDRQSIVGTSNVKSGGGDAKGGKIRSSRPQWVGRIEAISIGAVSMISAQDKGKNKGVCFNRYHLDGGGGEERTKVKDRH